MKPVQAEIHRVRAEFLEMPGLRLTKRQVERLCGVEQMVCALVLDALVDAKFLCLRPDGTYARLTDGESSRPRPAKADLASARRSLKAS